MKVSRRPFVVVEAKQVRDSASHSETELKVLWKSQLCTMRSQFLVWALYWIPVTVSMKIRARTLPVQGGGSFHTQAIAHDKVTILSLNANSQPLTQAPAPTSASGVP